MVKPQITQAIDQLNYQVSVGDVAAQSGLDLAVAQSDLLALASDVGAHLQVTESGDITYLFPRHYRVILRQKYWQIRLQELWQKIWAVLFYCIRIFFGIFLILSIVLIFAAIAIIIISSSSQDSSDRRNKSSRSFGSFTWIDWGGWLSSDGKRSKAKKKASDLNFLEAVFSVLFGDGNPNENREERRWQMIGQMIRQHQGAIIAEQARPYLDLPPAVQDEDFMVPVLSRFNGYPIVTEQGELLYHFPELQTTAVKREQIQVASAFQEHLWAFSMASTGQKALTFGLGILNLVGGFILWGLLQDPSVTSQLAGFVAFVASVLWLLLAYGLGFVMIPIGRALWIQAANRKIQSRNEKRHRSAIALEASELQTKLKEAQAYRDEIILSEQALAYRTDQDLLEQSIDQLS